MANFNSPGQTVISGEQGALDQVSEKCKQAGAKRVLPLQVSGAFHSPLMEGAAEALADSIDRVIFENAKCPVVTNVDGEAHVAHASWRSTSGAS